MQFDWLTAFWVIIQEPEFCQIWDWWWNINESISFHFRLFPGKTNGNIFQIIQKVFFWGPFWVFLLKSGQIRINHFLNIQVIYHHAKNQKKVLTHSWDKCWTYREATVRQADRQRDIGHIIDKHQKINNTEK